MDSITQRLARTYNTRAYDDPVDAVEDYHRVQRAAANHPDKKSTALSKVVELPRSRIRSWVDSDGMPDPARGLSTAQSKRWVNVDPEEEIATALAALAGHLLGGGSIATDSYVPAIAEGRRVTTSDITAAFRGVGVRATTRHTDVDGRATEVYPSEHASVLGRTLVAWGLPTGEPKPTELPELLEQVNGAGQEAFVRAYIRHRGTNLPERATAQCIASTQRVSRRRLRPSSGRSPARRRPLGSSR